MEKGKKNEGQFSEGHGTWKWEFERHVKKSEEDKKTVLFERIPLIKKEE